jgi:hypothetical protein
MPGKKNRSLKKPEVYEKLIQRGHDPSSAAAISNSIARKQRRKRKP